MAYRQRRKKDRPSRTEGDGLGKRKTAQTATDRNLARREKYHSDEEYRTKVIERSRQTYRNTHPKGESKLADGLLREGTIRQIMTDGLEHPEYVTVFRMSEAAQALGRSMLTLKRWIKEDLIPGPILQDVVYGYMHYSEGELKLIAGFLAEHERDYEYLHYTHTTTIHRIAQGLEAYRKLHL